MYAWLEIRGELKNFKDLQPFHAFIALRGDVPEAMVLDYLQHYLDAGTREELELSTIRFSVSNIACAALTYRYLRQHGRMLVHYSTNPLDAAPASLGPRLFADDMIEVWGLPGTSERPASVFG